MTDALSIAFLGFPTTEQSAISRILTLAGRAVPAHRVVDDVGHSNFVIVNGSSRQIVRFFVKVRRDQKAIVIGNENHGSGLVVCPRPIRVMELLTAMRDALAADVPNLGEHTVSTFLNSQLNERTAMPAAPQPRELASVTVAHSDLAVTDERERARAPVLVPPLSPPKIAPATMPVEVSIMAPATIMNYAKAPLHVPTIVRASPSVLVQTALSAASETLPVVADPKANELAQVLVVDDSDLAALALSARVTKHNLRCLEARSGEDALSKTGAHQFKLVFLDVNMPDLDGYSVCRSIKRAGNREKPAPKVVMVTSRGGTVDRIRGKMVGCDAYLTKPVSNESLTATLKKFGLIA